MRWDKRDFDLYGGLPITAGHRLRIWRVIASPFVRSGSPCSPPLTARGSDSCLTPTQATISLTADTHTSALSAVALMPSPPASPRPNRDFAHHQPTSSHNIYIHKLLEGTTLSPRPALRHSLTVWSPPRLPHWLDPPTLTLSASSSLDFTATTQPTSSFRDKTWTLSSCHTSSRTSSERAQELPTLPIFVTEKVHVSIERNRTKPTKWRTGSSH